MKRIIVFGGAGRTGSLVVKQALVKGYKVSAFTFSAPSTAILPAHKNLTIIQGDATNFKSVKSAIVGHDVVINIIAPKLFDSNNYPISEIATKNIITAMQQLGVSRYIGQAGAWATDQISDASILMQLGFKLFLPLKHLYSYKKKEDVIVKTSGINYTLVRCGILTDKKGPAKYRIFKDRYTCGVIELPKIRRTNVAEFEVSIIEDSSYYATCPIIIE